MLSSSHPGGLATQPLAAGFWARVLPLVSPDFFLLAKLPRLMELKICWELWGGWREVAGNNKLSLAGSAPPQALLYVTTLGKPSPSVPLGSTRSHLITHSS